MTTPFTYATDTGTLVVERCGDYVHIDVHDYDGIARARIPTGVTPSIATALLEAAGYGYVESLWDRIRVEAQIVKFIQSRVDELKGASGSGELLDLVDALLTRRYREAQGDDVDEYVNTRPGRRVAVKTERISVADRVVAVGEEDRPGIVTSAAFTRMGDPAWMVQWDDDPEDEDGPYESWELRKVNDYDT